jgi:hypothetical protein
MPADPASLELGAVATRSEWATDSPSTPPAGGGQRGMGEATLFQLVGQGLSK